MNNHTSRPVEFGAFSRSAVDILIPFHAQYEKVSDLVRSIVLAVKSNPYQITLIDDCSDNRNFGEEVNKEFLKAAPEGTRPQVRCVRSERQLGFGGALKLGFESTSLPWVMFMHSDTLVNDPNFMISMGRSLLGWKRDGLPVKMVTATSDNPNDGVAAKDKDYVLDASMPMFCCMCNRDLFSYVGGFLKTYPFAWYEDEEFAHRMKRYGLAQGVCARAKVKHHGSATIKYMWETNPETKKVMESNRELCLDDMRSAENNS